REWKQALGLGTSFRARVFHRKLVSGIGLFRHVFPLHFACLRPFCVSPPDRHHVADWSGTNSGSAASEFEDRLALRPSGRAATLSPGERENRRQRWRNFHDCRNIRARTMPVPSPGGEGKGEGVRFSQLTHNSHPLYPNLPTRSRLPNRRSALARYTSQ